MEDKILVTSQRYNIQKLLKTFIIIAFAGAIIFSLAIIIDQWSYYYFLEDYYKYKSTLEFLNRVDFCDNGFSFAIHEYFDLGCFFWAILILGGISGIGLIIYGWLHSYELIVTDKRIYGKVAFGKRVDLPLDSVSATATIQTLKGISVSTSSGRISFLAIKNAKEIYEVINNLLIKRQNEKKTPEVIIQDTVKTDEADQIKKYKDLLDSGVISQEEFDAKKKQLLSL